MDIGNENDPELRLEQILGKVEVVLLCCSIGAITIYYIVLLVLRLVVVLLLRKNRLQIHTRPFCMVSDRWRAARGVNIL